MEEQNKSSLKSMLLDQEAKDAIYQEEQQMLNDLGGGPPPGYGAHPLEIHLWETPKFRIHPLTQKLEAVGGLYHRLWPHHVRILQNMKKDGWPHIEIVAVSKFLWRRQMEEFQQKSSLADQHRQMKQQEEQAAISSMYGGGVQGPMPPGAMSALPPMPAAAMSSNLPVASPPAEVPQGASPEAGAEMPVGMGEESSKGVPEETPEESLSRGLSSEEKYFQKLENFRGRNYSKDAPSAGELTRAISADKSPFYRKGPSLRKKLFFESGSKVRIKKGDTTGGERALAPEELQTKKDHSFTRKEVGVANTAFPSQVDKREEKKEDSV